MKDDYNDHSVDATLSRIEEKLDGIVSKMEKHDDSIEDLNKWKWFSSGIGAACGFILDRLIGK